MTQLIRHCICSQRSERDKCTKLMCVFVCRFCARGSLKFRLIRLNFSGRVVELRGKIQDFFEVLSQRGIRVSVWNCAYVSINWSFWLLVVKPDPQTHLASVLPTYSHKYLKVSLDDLQRENIFRLSTKKVFISGGVCMYGRWRGGHIHSSPSSNHPPSQSGI